MTNFLLGIVAGVMLAAVVVKAAMVAPPLDEFPPGPASYMTGL